MEHVYLTPKTHGCDRTHENCMICDGGLAACTVCGGAECELPKECPGRKMTADERKAVGQGTIDFIDGQWTGKKMRLYYHPESDSLFWDEFCADGLCEDVTDIAKFQDAAAARGIKCPGPITEVISVPAKGFANAIVASYKKWERKPADLYPTPVDGTESLIPVLKAMKRPDGTPIKRIWEPACGDGRLARVLEWHGFEVVASDIREYPGYGVGGLDFLNDDPAEKWGWDLGEIDAIITNPPFSLAEEFIRKSLSITPNVAMLLKQTFWNVGGRSRGLWFDHMPDLELKLTWRLAFLESERGKSPLMDCMWNVWNGDNTAMSKHSADRTVSKQCVTEPLPRIKYQGYDKTGVRSSVEILEGAMDELTKAMHGWLDNLKD